MHYPLGKENNPEGDSEIIMAATTPQAQGSELFSPCFQRVEPPPWFQWARMPLSSTSGPRTVEAGLLHRAEGDLDHLDIA